MAHRAVLLVEVVTLHLLRIELGEWGRWRDLGAAGDRRDDQGYAEYEQSLSELFHFTILASGAADQKASTVRSHSRAMRPWPA
jgi:hypothetical protein